MSTAGEPLVPSTPETSAAAAQTREAVPIAPAKDEIRRSYPGEGVLFSIDDAVTRAIHTVPYEREPEDPIYRPLRIFTRDPATSTLEGAVALVNVPYEPLTPGPVGAVFEVVDFDDEIADRYVPAVDLESAGELIRDGRKPSPSDFRFHQQMVYAVCTTVYHAFRAALGRHLAWGFDPRPIPHKPTDLSKLRIRPHAFRGTNAYYDESAGEICFGYYPASPEVVGRNLPGEIVFTCLQHDVVVHEVTHALLDGLRAHFTLPTGPDVLAFHEGFADLVAIFQHFSYKEVVLAAIRESRGELDRSRLLTDLATQFGHTTGHGQALRTAVRINAHGDIIAPRYDPALGPHELGSVLVSAVFEAFSKIFRRKTERYIRLATGGTGKLREGELPEELREVLADEASKLANQFLTLCVRAIDYCPPVDIEMGEYLRAVLTADHDLVPDDPWGYREAWIDAFRVHGIYPSGVTSLFEDALLWRAPTHPIPPVEALSFASLRFHGDPARPAGEEELRRQACALGAVVSRPEFVHHFGLAAPGRSGDDVIERPCVHSIRSSRRVGPQGQVIFDLVAEVTQRRWIVRKGERFGFYGGSTIILGPEGEFRYVIGKGVKNDRRMEDQLRFTRGGGAAYWNITSDMEWRPEPQPFRLMHEKRVG
ncbi:MAG TPA: hypothetical protein VFZ18_13170 [Longimicrobiaceae bacterium]